MLSRNAAKERNSQNNRDRRIRENYRSDKEIKTRENQRRNERERSRDKFFFSEDMPTIPLDLDLRMSVVACFRRCILRNIPIEIRNIKLFRKIWKKFVNEMHIYNTDPQTLLKRLVRFFMIMDYDDCPLNQMERAWLANNGETRKDWDGPGYFHECSFGEIPMWVFDRPFPGTALYDQIKNQQKYISFFEEYKKKQKENEEKNTDIKESRQSEIHNEEREETDGLEISNEETEEYQKRMKEDNDEIMFIEKIKEDINNLIKENYNLNANMVWNEKRLQKSIDEPPEWMKHKSCETLKKIFDFGKEIINYEFMSYSSKLNREKTKQILENIIKTKKPLWKIYLFGSYEQGISTEYSDLDFEIMTFENFGEIYQLEFIAKIIKKDFEIKCIIKTAKVPIIKAVCKTTKIKVDISVDRLNGYETAKAVKDIFEKNLILKFGFIAMKTLLQINGLNDTSKKGMNSFLLFHLMFYFYNEYKSNKIKFDKNFKENNPEYVGEFLIYFLDFYVLFDNKKQGLEITKNNCKIFLKEKENDNIYVKSIEENKYIGESCDYLKIKYFFKQTYDSIKENIGKVSSLFEVLKELK